MLKYPKIKNELVLSPLRKAQTSKTQVFFNLIVICLHIKHFTMCTYIFFTIKLFAYIHIFIYIIYEQFDKWNSWTAYVDTVTTAIFFVAMWLMAKRKVESWIFWIIGDIITVPLYFYKGLTISSIQYLIFTVLAILGYLSWKKTLLKNSH